VCINDGFWRTLCALEPALGITARCVAAAAAAVAVNAIIVVVAVIVVSAAAIVTTGVLRGNGQHSQAHKCTHMHGQ